MPVVDGELVAQGWDLELESDPPAEAGAERCHECKEDGLHGGGAGYPTLDALTGVFPCSHPGVGPAAAPILDSQWPFAITGAAGRDGPRLW